MRCPSCNTEVPAVSRFCLGCGGAIAQAEPAATETISTPQRKSSALSSSVATEEGRFPAGTLLGERYRVLGLLGRGGMGEVYRATDLTLNQPVALKFLPEATASDERLLERFHGEVRIARQVSHPNVCRVYDIGKLDGSPYISMEYVDGEDLGSLLRRIGRLPGDKAVEIARRLCAGLAAAHAKGVLHRDLKPANIMIDGRGNVLIMDFGLAAIANQVEGAEVRNGTPAYMAPEQLAGREVTVRSDIYSLGLVLYEIFTGKRAFETRDRTALPNAASVVKDIDPAVERLIERCLDPDPAKRPASALAVARALPGGDPLAEALAAGDMPSPEMVAASDETGAISVRAALLSIGLIVGGLIAVVALSSRTNILRITPFPDPPDALARRARDLAVRFGYADRPADSAYGFSYDTLYRQYAQRDIKPEEYGAQIAQGQPPLVYFWYRQSPQYLETTSPNANVSPNDPPPMLSDMIEFHLDPQGRLTFLRAVPPQLDPASAPARPMNWNPLFEAAGLDQSQWTPVESEQIPMVSFDARAAWTGTYPHAPSVPLRIEAAAWKGRPVYFYAWGPWFRPLRMQPQAERTLGQRAGQWLGLGLLSSLALVAITLAWRNFRRGRGDLPGASRLAAFAFGCYLVAWLLEAHHVPSAVEVGYLLQAIGRGLLSAAFIWILYLALEPYVRRRWPQSLISWTRLLAGGIHDPLVGGHFLVGTLLGVGLAIFYAARTILLARGGTVPTGTQLAALLGPGRAMAEWISSLESAIPVALGIFFLFFLLRAILRRTWLAAAVGLGLLTALIFLSGSGQAGLLAAFASVELALAVWTLTRFGVLPMVLGIFVSDLLGEFPLTSDFSSWYSGITVFAVGTALALALWSFRVALGGRKVWKEEFLDG